MGNFCQPWIKSVFGGNYLISTQLHYGDFYWLRDFPKQKSCVSSQSLGSWTSINASIMTIFMAAFLTCQMVWKKSAGVDRDPSSTYLTKRLPSTYVSWQFIPIEYSNWSPLHGFHPSLWKKTNKTEALSETCCVEVFCRGQIAIENAYSLHASVICCISWVEDL